MFRLGIDAGGTFTDFWLTGDASDAGERIHKTPSTPEDPPRAVIRGIEEMAASLGLAPGDFLSRTELIVHGTTVATNAVITGEGARAGLITTRGFRDVLEMRRGWREEFFNNKASLPKPLIRRALRLTAGGRMDEAGREIEPLDEAAVREAALRLKAEGCESLVICLMHAWANPAHERRAAEIVRAHFPEAFLTVSSELLPQIRLYERVSTSAFNAYVGPIIRRHMEKLEETLAARGFGGALLVMCSHGGVTTPSVAVGRAASLLLSGPAAGPAAAARAAAPHGAADYIVTDMGGTSFDVALVREGKPLVTQESWIERRRLALPSLDIHTLGAGGGSISWVDEGGILHVGPQSAGARPGPACYGLGGEEPTATDACLLLGHLDPAYFLGGEMRIDPKAAERAIRRRVAEPLGMGAEEAALGMYELICVQMAAGIREVTVRRGLDPRDFLLIAAGGAGPLHANLIARELEIPLILVPRNSATFCAAGMAESDLKHDLAASWRAPMDALAAAALGERLEALRRDCAAALAAQGVPAGRMIFEPGADLRYLGQYHEVTVPLPAEEIGRPGVEALLARFHARHDALYGYATAEMPVECITLRMSGRGLTQKREAAPRPLAGEDPAAARRGERPVRLPGTPERLPAAVYRGEDLRPGHRLPGPAIVEEPHTTILVLPGYELARDPFGNSLIWPEASAAEMAARFLGRGGEAP
ncbi:MAG: hydantoinase/oxoprolinase family protein [bacterium]